MENKITLKKLPHTKHAEYLDDMEKMANLSFTDVIENLTTEIGKLLKRKKLAKSDDRKRGWTGEVPKIEADFDELLSKVIDKHLRALKYLLLGKAAGKESEVAAKETKALDRSFAGMIQSAYFSSIDTHREYYDILTGKTPRTIPKELLKETVGQIEKKTSRFIDESLMRLSNSVISSVEMEAEKLKHSNIDNTIEGDDTEDELDQALVMDAIRDAGESYRPNWNRMVSMDLTLASAIGTHQSVQEIYNGKDDDVKVAWVAMRDEKTCVFCKEASRNPDGSFKLYNISEFEPAGYNYARKKSEWKLCIPGAHPNCRCTLVYIPKGFVIDKNGTVSRQKKN